MKVLFFSIFVFVFFTELKSAASLTETESRPPTQKSFSLSNTLEKALLAFESKDFATAYPLFKEQAEKGSILSAVYLAYLSNIKGLRQDFKQFQCDFSAESPLDAHLQEYIEILLDLNPLADEKENLLSSLIAAYSSDLSNNVLKKLKPLREKTSRIPYVKRKIIDNKNSTSSQNNSSNLDPKDPLSLSYQMKKLLEELARYKLRFVNIIDDLPSLFKLYKGSRVGGPHEKFMHQVLEFLANYYDISHETYFTHLHDANLLFLAKHGNFLPYMTYYIFYQNDFDIFHIIFESRIMLDKDLPNRFSSTYSIRRLYHEFTTSLPSLAQIRPLMQKVVESANAPIKYSLAFYYATMCDLGQGGEINKEKAHQYYHLALQSTDEEVKSKSAYSYARLCMQNKQDPKNKEEALHYFELTLESQDPQIRAFAQYALANLFFEEADTLDKIALFKTKDPEGYESAMDHLYNAAFNGILEAVVLLVRITQILHNPAPFLPFEVIVSDEILPQEENIPNFEDAELHLQNDEVSNEQNKSLQTEKETEQVNDYHPLCETSEKEDEHEEDLGSSITIHIQKENLNKKTEILKINDEDSLKSIESKESKDFLKCLFNGGNDAKNLTLKGLCKCLIELKCTIKETKKGYQAIYRHPDGNASVFSWHQSHKSNHIEFTKGSFRTQLTKFLKLLGVHKSPQSESIS